MLTEIEVLMYDVLDKLATKYGRIFQLRQIHLNNVATLYTLQKLTVAFLTN